MRKATIMCWAGHSNFGDELILEGAKQLFKNWDITIMSSDNKGAYPLIDFNEVNKCDLFVLGGGELIMKSCLFMNLPNLFDKIGSSRFSSYYRLTPFGRYSWIHKVHIPKVILGCGVNAKDASELSMWTVNGLQQFDYIGLRDNISVNILRSFPQLRNKVYLSYDLSFALKSIDLLKDKENYAIVIPTDRFSFGDRGVKENNVAKKSLSWLKEKLVGFNKVYFLAFGEQDNNDYETCKTLSSCVGNSEILNYNDLSLPKVSNLFSKTSKVFPYRLHGLIFSYIAGVPYEFYPYHWKLQRVYDTIKNLSFKEIQIKQKELFTEMLQEVID